MSEGFRISVFLLHGDSAFGAGSSGAVDQFFFQFPRGKKRGQSTILDRLCNRG